jgi:hypothetical protein
MMGKFDSEKRINLNIGIDLSGKPPETVYVGLVSFNIYTQDKFIGEFKREYTDVWETKGKKLTRRNLTTVLDFFNCRDVRMVTIKYTTNDWVALHSLYPDKGYVTDKMLGMLYFTAIRRVVRSYTTTNIITCEETGIDINKVHETIQRIGKWNNYTFHLSRGIEKFHPIIKIADYVASISRNLRNNVLDKYPNFIIEDRKNIPSWVYKKVFR